MSDRITSEQVRRWSLTIVEERRLADQMDADAALLAEKDATIARLEAELNRWQTCEKCGARCLRVEEQP